MAFELRDGQMFIFPNEKSGGNRPTHTGNAKIDGVEYRVSCWEREGRNGQYFSCNIITKEEFDAQMAARSAERGSTGGQSQSSCRNESKPKTPSGQNFDDFDDDIPF